jgi:bifunctional DNA-binding transcriptional regulator/antitoxin component of YhaV-PrlF toxin-antitoxin module
MPRLVKGGKWVYGWVVVGPEGEIILPPEARREYGFQAEAEVLFLRGSRSSGGFGISSPGQITIPLAGRALGRGRISEDGQVTVPPEIGVQPGDRLLAVRGSGRALGFVARGPIYEEALGHPELEVF